MTTKEMLADFLKTGGLKNIDYELSRQELNDLLGETDWVHFSGRQKKNPSIIKYDRVEFYFDNENSESRIIGIMFQFSTKRADKKKLICDYNQWNEKTNLKTVVDFLTSNKISFKSSHDNDGTTIVTESKVEIYFDENNYLQKIGKFINR